VDAFFTPSALGLKDGGAQEEVLLEIAARSSKE